MISASPPEWQRCSSAPEPDAGAIDIWRADVREIPENAPWRAHWGKKMFQAKEPVRQSRIASRLLLDTVLSYYLFAAPEDIVILRETNGRPYSPGTAVDFNLSHSGHWVLLAVANGTRLGVDVERFRLDRDLMAISRRYFSRSEAQEIEGALDVDEQARCFYGLWTAKEAALKARGTGIANGLADTNRTSAGRIRLIDGEEMHLRQFTIEGDYAAAVAWDAPAAMRLRFFHATLPADC